MSTDNMIARSWASFEKIAMPHDAPQIQREEMRKAFFAGASILFEIITRAADDGSDEPTAADLAIMDGLDRELRAFGAGFDAMLGIKR